MSTDTMTATQVYRVYIKATPQAIWDAITKPEWTERYGYTNRADFDLRPGGAYKAYAERGDEARWRGQRHPDPRRRRRRRGAQEVDPPHTLVTTWRMLMDPESAPEGFTRLTFEIAETNGGVSRLTVTHELENAPRLALVVGGGARGHRRRRWLGVGAERPEVAARERRPHEHGGRLQGVSAQPLRGRRPGAEAASTRRGPRPRLASGCLRAELRPDSMRRVPGPIPAPCARRDGSR